MGRQMSRSIEKAKTPYLATFADGDERTEQWTMLTKSGDGRVQHTLLLSHLLPSFPRTYCSLPPKKTATRIKQEML